MAQHRLAHLGVALGLGEVAADNVAATADANLLGLQFGVAPSAARDDKRHARGWIVQHNLLHLLGRALTHTQDIFEAALFEAGDGLRTDHAAIGHHADPADSEALTQPVDHRDERGDVGGVARPHLRTYRSAVLVHDDADDHLLLMRPVILRMAALAERLPALPFEIQGGRVHEHDGEIAQQIAPPLEQPFLDQILDATGTSVRSA